MTEQELIQEATKIRDENRTEWNTANRIGSFLLNLISFLDDSIISSKNDVTLFNVTNKIPLSAGFYSPETARATIPKDIKKNGLIITYQIDANNWNIEQYISGDISKWSQDENWEKIGNKNWIDEW